MSFASRSGGDAAHFDFLAILTYQSTSTFPGGSRLKPELVDRHTHPARNWIPWLLTVFLSLALKTSAQLWINEILINPPGTDSPNEYVELRGTPNSLLPAGTYFVAVEGDTNGNPGTIQHVFDLSNRRIGGNGFLVLLQNSNSYAVSPNATILVNTNGAGFGSGSGSSIGHHGESGQTDLENPSVTFFLLQSTNYPTLGADIDGNNDGTPDGALYASWTVFDAVAILDSDGPGDIGYGKINFRRSTAPGNGATVVSGTIVPVDFTAAYVGRTGNTTNWQAASWAAGNNLLGTAPNWTLSSIDTVPNMPAGQALNHIGLPNFGASNFPGVVVRESGGSTDVREGSGTDSFTIALNTTPSGTVTVLVSAPAQLQVSTNGGATFASAYALVFNSTNARTITVRAVDDNVVDTSPHTVIIRNSITATADPANYPVGALVPPVSVNVLENDTVLLNELKVNPPGPEDAPYEFIELLGAPNAVLTNVYLLVIEGNSELNPGTASAVIDLTGAELGASGLLVILGDGHPYSIPAGTRVLLAPQLSNPGGALGNGSVSFLLVSSPSPIIEGDDLDAGDNGVPEGLPAGTTILDSVAWLDGGNGDRIYSPAVLTQRVGTPDAATRLPGNITANSASAWINADLVGPDPESLTYAAQGGSAYFPYGTLLTVGSANKLAPMTSPIAPFSSVIGDPTTPIISFTVFDPDTPADLLNVSATSSVETVVPTVNLILGGSGSVRTLAINPTNVGYSTITITVAGSTTVGYSLVQYAASADLRGGGRFHTGVSDGSTAIAVDANYMIEGDDENQVLRLYSRSNSGAAMVEFDMNPFLGLLDFYDDGTPREIDLEASTRVGNRLYWLGSHSHSRDSEVRTNRGRIFVTDLSGSGTNITLTYAGRYDYLKLDLMNWDATNGHGRGSNYFGLTASGAPGVDPKAPDGSGFNIEGLAMAPGSTNTAYICFRAPLVPATNRAKALIVAVTNFTALAISSATNPGVARFGAPIELNLGGRGVRSMEGNSNGYLIVAGPPAAVANGSPPNDFRLFSWNGLAGNAPQERGASLAHLIPEGIVDLPPAPWTSTSTVQLISDNGITIFYNDAVEAKHLPVPEFKKFRSDWVTLGPTVISQPVIKCVQRFGNNVVVTWYSVAGTTYRVQSKSALSDTTWSNVNGDVPATDALATKTISMAGNTQQFFRVVIP